VANDREKVAIISGGGAGHEPAFAGYVRKGLLAASVSGTIFASPSAEQIRRAIVNKISQEKDILILVMQYTGDLLNLGLAAEQARASGRKIEFVAIGDDIGVGRRKSGKVGRRGIAGITLILKIIGAFAEQGSSLEQVPGLARHLSNNLASVGVSLQWVQIPGRDISDKDQGMVNGQVEVVMGIHNESGSCRVTATLPEIVKLMLDQLLDTSDQDRNFAKIRPEDQAILLINNLGGFPPLEISGITQEFCKQAKELYGVVPVRILSGTFLSSLNNPGWSSSFQLEGTESVSLDSLINLFDAPAEAQGWPVSRSRYHETQKSSDEDKCFATAPLLQPKMSNLIFDPIQATKVLTAGLRALIAAEPEVTRFYSIVGDGDCRFALKGGAVAVLREILSASPLSEDALAFINRIVPVVETNMDGTSGAIFAIFLNEMIIGLRRPNEKVSG
jgi:triose/dihydroxyacetone kinase / FAD-AMP lyase (cyclizing)